MSKTFNTYSAETGEVLEGEFMIASAEETASAMEASAVAFSVYSKTSVENRAKFLETIADEIEALGDELIQRASAETGLPNGRFMGERGRTCGQLRSFAAIIREGSWVEARVDYAQPDRTPMPRVDIRKMLVPIGPIVVFGASNFPLAYSTAGGDTASAFAAGNTVVVKAHPAHAGTSELVAGAIRKAIDKCGLDQGIFNHLHDTGFELGKNLVVHPATKAVGFTGSLAGGRALLDMASKRDEPIPVFAEMGSINPVIILPETMKAQGSELGTAMAGSITLGVGQFCTNPGLILTIGNETEAFTSALADGIAASKSFTMLHKGISASYSKLKGETLGQSGVSVISEATDQGASNQGRPTVATVSGADFLANSNLHREVFGPFSLVVQCEDEPQLLKVISELDGQLTGSIFCESGELSNHPEVVEVLQSRVGRIICNGVPTGVEVCPAMQHGGPYPATTDSRFSAVGADAIKRFARPVSFQSWPQELLPEALKDGNPLGIQRVVDGEYGTN
ncbi:MAG: alpha-ketoglutaric semialdehyde dehydrogenase [Granulosicoccus sp.]|jgi:alpha-ketoglutaric semialdehyde dehydrogenase